MTDKIITFKAKRILDKYNSYAEYAEKASKNEKKTVLKSTIIKANKLQRQTAKQA